MNSTIKTSAAAAASALAVVAVAAAAYLGGGASNAQDLGAPGPRDLQAREAPNRERPASDLRSNATVPPESGAPLAVVAEDTAAPDRSDLVLYRTEGGVPCLSPLDQEGQSIDCAQKGQFGAPDEVWVVGQGPSDNSPARIWGAAPAQTAGLRITPEGAEAQLHDVYKARAGGKTFFLVQYDLAQRAVIEALDGSGSVIASVERGGGKAPSEDAQ